MTVRGELTVNFPVEGSKPTCTVCSKSTGDEMSIFLPSARVKVRKDKKKESKRDKAVTQHNKQSTPTERLGSTNRQTRPGHLQHGLAAQLNRAELC